MKSGGAYLVGDRQSFPKPVGDEPPEEDQEGIAPVDDGTALSAVDRLHDQSSRIPQRETHGVMKPIIEQGRSHEAGTYIGEGDRPLFYPAELRQGVDVAVLETFGGGIGGGNPQSFRAGDGADHGDVSAAMSGEIVVGGKHHAGESLYVGLDGVHLDGLVEAAVLMADARAEQENVHAAQLFDERRQLRRGGFRRHVKLLEVYLGGGDRLQGFQPLYASSGYTDLIAFLYIMLGYLVADARGGSDDDDSFQNSKFLILHS